MPNSQSYNLNTLITTYTGQDLQGEVTEQKLAAALAAKVRYKTPYDYDCVGDGVTDDSANFLKFLTQDTNKQGYIPVGTFLIKSSNKIPLIDLVGESQTQSIVKFTDPNGGFQKYNQGTYNGYGGFGNLYNFTIHGNGTCNDLIDVGYGSEGICDKVYFAQAARSAIKVDYQLELVFFQNCTGSVLPNFFYVDSGANQSNSLNANFFEGGNYYSITNFINTPIGGNLDIKGAWLEQVQCILNKTGTIPFNLDVHQNHILQTAGPANLFNISCKGQDNINFNENKVYFGTVNTNAIFNIFAYGDNTSDSKSLKMKGNNISGGASTNLTNVLTVDASVTNLFNIRFILHFNDMSFTFSWWNNILSKINSGVITSGTDDVKLASSQFLNQIRFSTDNQSIINYDSTNKQLYTSDSGGSAKNPLGVFVGVPASATATGLKGQWSSDGTYLYICYAANTWRRVAVAAW